MFNKGEVVLVDGRVLTASPVRREYTVKCEVIEGGETQTYVAFFPPCRSSPMYVRNSDIIRRANK